MRDGERRSLRSDPVLIALSVLAVAIVPWFGLELGGSRSTWLLQTAIDVVDVVLAIRLARVTGGQRFWRAVTVAMISCGVGDVVQTVRVLANPAEREPSLVQTVLIVGGMAVVVVVMLLHPLGGTGRQRLRLWMDSATVLTGVAVFLWYFSLAPAVTAGNTFQAYTGGAICAVMLLISFGLVKLVLGGTAPFTRSAGAVAVIGLTGTAVGASVTSAAFGGSRPDLVFIAQVLPCVIVPVALRLQELQHRAGVGLRTEAQRRRWSRMPYLAVTATQALLVVALLLNGPGMRVGGVTVGAVVITALVLTRQLAAFHDNERLLAQVDAAMREARALHDALRHQATHDTLTGLANRAVLEQAMPESGTVCVLLVDLDGFKPVNDRYGHHAGDQVLIAVARCLELLTGDAGTALRLGGDEFAVVLPSATAATGSELAALITAAVTEPIEIGDDRVAVGASIGVAAGPARDADRVFREADAAMYRRKAERRLTRIG